LIPFTLALGLAGVAGFLAISLEILWYRAFAFASAQAAVTGPLLAAASLAGFAEGAWYARSVCQQYLRTNRTVRTAAACFAIATGVGALVIPALARIVELTGWTWALPLVGASCAGFGASLTFLAHLSINPDAVAGSRLSRFCAATLAGSALATLFTGLVLTQSIQTAALARVVVLLGGAAALIIAAPVTRGKDRLIWLGSLSGAALVISALSPLLHDAIYERMLYKDRYRGERFAAVAENRHGVIGIAPDSHVVENGIDRGPAVIDVDDRQSRLVRAFAIPALSASPTRVLIIGLGTGAWPRVVAGLSSVHAITIVDANAEHLNLVSRSSDAASLLRNSKVRVVVDDPRRWLERHPEETFDVIVSPADLGWRAHASHLLSVEFMELAREHLTAGGLLYFNAANAPSAFRAAFDVFPYGLRFLDFAAVSMAPVTFNESRWRQSLARYRLDGVAPFDTTTSRGRARVSAFLATPRDAAGWFGSPALESRASMLPRLRDVAPITDDNMGGEWRVGGR
jgi:SAM-dependent methyltransferase